MNSKELFLKKMKHPYVAPELTVVAFHTEHVFASLQGNTTTNFNMDSWVMGSAGSSDFNTESWSMGSAGTSSFGEQSW